MSEDDNAPYTNCGEDKIPTAEETFLEYNAHGFDCKCGCQDGGNRTRAAMRKFAMIHVERALKAAADTPNEISGEPRSYDDRHFITNSYPLTNIQ